MEICVMFFSRVGLGNVCICPCCDLRSVVLFFSQRSDEATERRYIKRKPCQNTPVQVFGPMDGSRSC